MPQTAREAQDANARVGRGGAFLKRPLARRGKGARVHADVMSTWMECGGGRALHESLWRRAAELMQAVKEWYDSSPMRTTVLGDRDKLSMFWAATGCAERTVPPIWRWGVSAKPRAEGPGVQQLHNFCEEMGICHRGSAMWCRETASQLPKGTSWSDFMCTTKCTQAALQLRSIEHTEQESMVHDSIAPREQEEQQANEGTSEQVPVHDSAHLPAAVPVAWDEDMQAPLASVAAGMSACAYAGPSKVGACAECAFGAQDDKGVMHKVHLLVCHHNMSRVLMRHGVPSRYLCKHTGKLGVCIVCSTLFCALKCNATDNWPILQVTQDAAKAAIGSREAICQEITRKIASLETAPLLRKRIDYVQRMGPCIFAIAQGMSKWKMLMFLQQAIRAADNAALHGAGYEAALTTKTEGQPDGSAWHTPVTLAGSTSGGQQVVDLCNKPQDGVVGKASLYKLLKGQQQLHQGQGKDDGDGDGGGDDGDNFVLCSRCSNSVVASLTMQGMCLPCASNSNAQHPGHRLMGVTDVMQLMVRDGGVYTKAGKHIHQPCADSQCILVGLSCSLG